MAEVCQDGIDGAFPGWCVDYDISLESGMQLAGECLLLIVIFILSYNYFNWRKRKKKKEVVNIQQSYPPRIENKESQ